MKKRIIGALLLALVCVPLIWLGKNVFAFACGITACLALKEFVDLKEHHKKIPNAIFFLSVVVLMLFITEGYNSLILSLNLNFKCISLGLLLLFIPCIFYQDKNYSTHEAMYLFGCILFLALFFNSLIFIRTYNLWLLVYLILIAIFTDTFAYLIGSLFGKHKCCPKISPNKTWEGCIGGTLMGVLLASIFYLVAIHDLFFLKVILLTFVLVVVGQLGDLVFSKIKRENKLKDFSNIIPGHGGILDRLDSFIFIVISYVLLFGFII